MPFHTELVLSNFSNCTVDCSSLVRWLLQDILDKLPEKCPFHPQRDLLAQGDLDRSVFCSEKCVICCHFVGLGRGAEVPAFQQNHPAGTWADFTRSQDIDLHGTKKSSERQDINKRHAYFCLIGDPSKRFVLVKRFSRAG